MEPIQLSIQRFADPLPAAFWVLVGALLSHLWRRYRSRMIVLRWQASHQVQAMSATDIRFGTIEVLYNRQPVHNMVFSTIEVENESNSDLTNLDLNVFFQDGTTIYIAGGAVQGSANALPFTEDFTQSINRANALGEDDPARGPLLEYLWRRRDFHVPVLNRGGKLTIGLLVQAPPGRQPFVNLGCDHQGVRLLAQAPRQLIFGVHQGLAALLGLIVGGLLAIYVGMVTEAPLVIAVAAFLIGSFGAFIGAAAVRGFRLLLRLLD